MMSTTWCNLVAGLWNIKLGSDCRFYGLAHFKRYPCSKIEVGNHCTFRSSFRSNFVGINRPCALFTAQESAQLSIGDNCGFSGTSIAAYQNITIENNVLIGANCVVTDFDWHPISRHAENIGSAPIYIEQDAWIGMSCTILKGVHIGKGAVIGANSVVTTSIPDYVIAAGNPARVIRPIEG